MYISNSKLDVNADGELITKPESLKEFSNHFPNGPESIERLFGWREHNATTLLANDIPQQSFINLINTAGNIVVHEDFAGMGTGGHTLVSQFQAMKSLVAKKLPSSALD